MVELFPGDTPIPKPQGVSLALGSCSVPLRMGGGSLGAAGGPEPGERRTQGCPRVALERRHPTFTWASGLPSDSALYDW